MKIAFDVHGVIADRRDLFIPFLKMLKSNGIEVVIISGPTKSKIKKELDELGYTNVHYDKILSVVDFIKNKGIKMWQDHKHDWWANSKDWWGAKGEMCKIHKIDVLFDDSIQYKTEMPEETLFILFSDKNGEYCE
jgi:2-hydroxy-3-keto-5-methylthiopentenyl-1-phosphate phosphatase